MAMKISKKVAIVGVAAALLVPTVAVAGALISGSTGSVIKLSSAPASVKLNALQNKTAVHAFDERQGTLLAAPVAVDAVNPGTYVTFPAGSATIPAGTIVDSHLIHSDITLFGSTIRRQGTVTFANDILGVVASTNRLAASDAALGAPGTQYAGTTKWRGLEGGEANLSSLADKFTISADRRKVTFDLQTLVMDEIRVVTGHTNSLTTTITDSPDPVTAGNDVQYTVNVTNTGVNPVADAHAVVSLPAGTTFVSASAPGLCTGTGPVDCSVGALAVGASATAFVVATSPATVPDGGTMTVSAVGTPGVNTSASQTTTVEAPQPGVSKGYVVPGGSIEITGPDPAVLTLPNTGNGAPVIITQGDGTFCDGPCNGTTTEISPFDGYSDPENPIHLTLTYNFPEVDGDPNASLTAAATAFGSTIYKNDNPGTPNAGVPVAACASPGSGVAAPHPCVDARTIAQPTPNSFVVTFEIVYLSGDPRFGRR
jgi:uncharacterized repeat protein (TIGR01451 family)